MNNRVSSFGHTICIKHFYRLCCLMCLVSWARQLDIMMDMSRGIISRFMSSPFTTDSYPQLVKCKYLRFVLTLTYCSNRYTVDTDYTVWTNGSDFITYTMTVRTDQTGFENQIGFACSVNKGFLLKGTERFWVLSHFTWQRWGTVSPWWRKPNDAGQLSTEETLSLCVRVLQMKSPKKQGSKLSWSGFYTRVWN